MVEAAACSVVAASVVADLAGADLAGAGLHLEAVDLEAVDLVERRSCGLRSRSSIDRPHQVSLLPRRQFLEEARGRSWAVGPRLDRCPVRRDPHSAIVRS